MVVLQQFRPEPEPTPEAKCKLKHFVCICNTWHAGFNCNERTIGNNQTLKWPTPESLQQNGQKDVRMRMHENRMRCNLSEMHFSVIVHMLYYFPAEEQTGCTAAILTSHSRKLKGVLNISAFHFVVVCVCWLTVTMTETLSRTETLFFLLWLVCCATSPAMNYILQTWTDFCLDQLGWERDTERGTEG